MTTKAASMNKLREKLKSFIWPINKGEYRKFIPMFLIFFLISFNYNILRAVKDSLIITAPHSGAETIPYLKIWVMLPCAFLITCVFTKVSNKYSIDKVFYFMISIFILFFTLFVTVLYPSRDFLHPTAFANKLETLLPLGMHGLIAILRNWTFALFYVFAELWGTVILSVLFWGYANETTSVKEAKRFYAVFGIGANVACIFAGKTSIDLSKNIFNLGIPYGTTAWDQSILFLTVSVILVACLITFIFYFLNKRIVKENLLNKERKTQPKIQTTLRKSFSYLAKSKYLICLALIVLCYHVASNLIEVIWKHQAHQLYPNASDYNIYMGKVITLMGIISTVIALFFSSNLLRKFNWTFNALLPPIVVLITGFCFFSYFFFSKTTLNAIALLFGSTPLIISVFLGTVQNCMTRASKYTMFDATKEIAFIPLDKESKLKGKAAIDGIGSRIGKSGGAVIHNGLLMFFTTLSAAAPYIGFIFLGVIGIWLVAVKALGKQFNLLTEKQEAISLSEAKESIANLQAKVQKASVKEPLDVSK